MLVSEFDYHLPEELIAQEALPDRAASRLLYLDRQTGNFQDRTFRDFPDLLRPNDLLVINNSRVFPARLYGCRTGIRAQPLSPRNPASHDFLTGRIEVLLTRQVCTHPNEWECLVRPGRKIVPGEHLFFGEHDELTAEVIARGSFGERRLRFADVPDFFSLIERLGHVPLPPYIARPDSFYDRDRYQTVYAHERGSIAAPTAGLHFTPEILEQIKSRGIEIAEITLHVGLGTFQPIHTKTVAEHKLHSETYIISNEVADRINGAAAEGRRIVAVGTTTVRTLEHAAANTPSARVSPGRADADLFIYPGFHFRLVGALLTNFHLPRSTLLMLISAFAGKEFVLTAYRHAVHHRYRFFSYGDCMFVE